MSLQKSLQISILKSRIKAKLDDFDPSEPRDEDGKWTTGGGGSAAGATPKPKGVISHERQTTEGGRGERGGQAGRAGNEASVASGKSRAIVGSLPGLPKSSPGPTQSLRVAAENYAKSTGLPFKQPAEYVKADPERGAKIAQAFEAMKHDPKDPETHAAYQALITETLAQYQVIKGMGLKVEPIAQGAPNPYSNSKDLIADVRGGHIWYFKTEHGFGSDDRFNDHPLMAVTAEKNPDGSPMLANDVFRVVHDIFGHVKEGNGFGPDGEDNAWQSHVRMFTPLAARAMTSETRGQNSWVNFGPHGETNRSNPADTRFADQKAGLLPDWAVTEGRVKED